MSLLQMSIAGAVMILAIVVIRALAVNRLPKKTFLVLWGVVLLRLFIPFSLPSVVSIYSLMGWQRTSAGITENGTGGGFAGLFLGNEATRIAQESASALPLGISIWKIIWIAGMLICALVFFTAYIRCFREFQMSLPVDNDMSQSWLKEHKLRRTISIRQSDRISSPLTFGVLHPVILMPKKTDWGNEDELKYVLEHEFVHIKRFDILSKLALIAAVCLHWFNPFVWIMYVLANRDIELCCDETVVCRFGRETRASYARVLISMEETKSGFVPLCSHFSKNAIEERITAIMKTKKTTIISLVVALVLVVGIVAIFATSAQKEETSNNATTANAVESGDAMEPDAEYASEGISLKGNFWFYNEKPIAGIYDDNGGIYTNDAAADADCLYLNIVRDDDSSISKVSVISRKQFISMVDVHMNASEPVDDNSDMNFAEYTEIRAEELKEVNERLLNSMSK
ncbi:MAG: M56 family metallopeptidase [Lachnobacterium sp.]|nr:M56 family metallopeptidase [Lachnobacterium sp.]